MREKVLTKIQRDRERGATLQGLCSDMGIPYATFWRMIKGSDGVRIGVWEKAEAYYKNRRKRAT